MKEKKALLLIVLSWFIGLMLCGGCKQPVINYTIETKCNDVWEAKPAQSVSFKMNLR